MLRIWGKQPCDRLMGPAAVDIGSALAGQGQSKTPEEQKAEVGRIQDELMGDREQGENSGRQWPALGFQKSL